MSKGVKDSNILLNMNIIAENEEQEPAQARAPWPDEADINAAQTMLLISTGWGIEHKKREEEEHDLRQVIQKYSFEETIAEASPIRNSTNMNTSIPTPHRPEEEQIINDGILNSVLRRINAMTRILINPLKSIFPLMSHG